VHSRNHLQNWLRAGTRFLSASSWIWFLRVRDQGCRSYGLGTPDAQSADLVSYPLFDAAYTGALIDIGYRDADRRADEIEAFLRLPEDAAMGRAAT